MSLGLIKPGASVALRHPRTGALIEPIGFIRGKAVWPVLGGSGENDDENDPRFTGGGGGGRSQDDDPEDEDDEDSDDEDDEDDRDKRRRSKGKGKKNDDDDDEDDDDEDRRPRAVRQAARYRTRLRAEEQRTAELQARIKELENRDKKPEELTSQELKDARSEIDSLTEVNRIMSAQLAFFKTRSGVEWVDPSDAFALAEREGLFDDVIDEDGTVDTRELRRGLKDLAKRKPHLVVKPKTNSRADSDDDEDDEDERPRRSARSANGARRGSRQNGTSRAELAKKFPVLRAR